MKLNLKTNRRIGLLLFVLLFAAPACTIDSGSEQPRNLILLISDGCGPGSVTMTRDYKRLVMDDGTLVMDPYLIGTVQTWPADVRIADSAAAGTAFACGVKTKKGYVAVDTAGQPVGTLLEAAEKKGFWTGLITTSGITDATMSAFSAHTTDRYDQTTVAAVQLEGGFEVLLGGGRSFFQTPENGGQREDGQDLIDAARDLGYQYVSNREELLAPVTLPLLGLFAEDHMAFEIDRDNTDQPSLNDMVTVAIGLLSESENGFILIVETEGTDDAGHNNDAAADVREVLSYETAVETALAFAKSDGETLVVATSDHDAGGLAIGIGGYEWTPEVLTPVRVSMSQFRRILDRNLSTSASPDQFREFLRAEMEAQYGFSDLSEEQWTEIDGLITTASKEETGRRQMSRIAEIVNHEISSRAGLGWSTGGHTGIDVNLYAFGPASLSFRGSNDNTEIGRTLARVMGLDLDAMTLELRTSLPD